MIFTRLLILCSLTLLLACTSAKKVTTTNESRQLSNVPASEITAGLPNYTDQLNAVSGRGRAIVSEPGNSDRLTLVFQANRELSLLTAKNRLGIEGGKMLVDKDSILIYNRIEKYAQKIPVSDSRATSLNELVSINALDLLNFTVDSSEVRRVMESESAYILLLKDGAEVQVSKETMLIRSVRQRIRSDAPYSLIEYEGYRKTKGFTLPGKISIFSKDGDSRVSLTIRSLTVNPDKLNLELKIPDKIQIERI